jgi:hypothetical protein
MNIDHKHSTQPLQKGSRIVSGLAITGAAGCFALAMSFSQPVFAQVGSTSHVEIEGQVVSVDQAARTVVVRGPDGNEQTVKVAPGVRNLAQVKAGDTVDVDIVHSVLLELRAAEDLSAATTTSVARAPVGDKPAAMGVERNYITAKIVAIDKKHYTVTLVGPKGRHEVFQVKDPDMRAELVKLSPGQVIRATFTDAVAVAVNPSAQ